ncbi:hypothetical protein GQR58_024132 [Nymphon striatum]|nr:hypothetical protein GQR58_024132 [Nymphon striatum]
MKKRIITFKDYLLRDYEKKKFEMLQSLNHPYSIKRDIYLLIFFFKNALISKILSVNCLDLSKLDDVIYGLAESGDSKIQVQTNIKSLPQFSQLLPNLSNLKQEYGRRL